MKENTTNKDYKNRELLLAELQAAAIALDNEEFFKEHKDTLLDMMYSHTCEEN